MAAQVIYDPGTGAVTLAFARGPVGFTAAWVNRGTSNVASSGAARERVVQNRDLMLSFTMPHMLVAGDAEAWESFLAFALDGGTFKFYPSAAFAYWCNCVLESEDWTLRVSAPKKYGASIQFRVLEDSQTPAGPVQVLRRFYGINP